eukprot:gene18514-20370_t
MKSLATITLKTPNQRFSDLIVTCDASWTVNMLKRHLSTVYPSKPTVTCQKLIYCGELLDDDLKLWDILIKENTSHVVHILCDSPTTIGKRDNFCRKTVDKDSQDLSSFSSTESKLPFDVDQPCQTRTLTATYNSSMLDWNAYVREMYHYYSTWEMYHKDYQHNADEAFLKEWHTNMMLHHSLVESLPTGTPLGNMQHSEERFSQEDVVPDQPEGEQEHLPGNDPDPVQPLNAGGAMFDDDNDENAEGRRDWLDWVHMFMRASVMLSIMYFYSSTIRILMIGLLCLLIYLYQAGWLLHIRNLRGARAAEQPNQNGERVEEPNQNEEENHPTEHSDFIQNSSSQEIPRVLQDNSRITAVLNVLYTFVTSFFTSLLPPSVQ